jgi:DNA polymerase-3 subunit gamma/tau
MVLVRIAHAASLPPPAELIEKLQKGEGAGTPRAAAPPAPSAAGNGAGNGGASARSSFEAPRGGAKPQPHATPEPEPENAPQARASGDPAADLPKSFVALVELLEKHREARLAGELRTAVHLVRYEPGRIEFRPGERADATLANRLGPVLAKLTGTRWAVLLASAPGDPTLAEQSASAAEARRLQAAEHPLVKAALAAFPGAKIVDVRGGAPAVVAHEPPLPDPDAYGEMDPDIMAPDDDTPPPGAEEEER